LLILLTIVHVLVCIFLILVVLLQQGKGADLSVFGGGGTQAAFGARGATTLLHKLTVASFVAFVVTTMAIGFLTTARRADDVLEGLPGETLPAAPPVTAEPAPAPEPAAPAAESAPPVAPAPAPSEPPAVPPS
jgi:preprotein translocase subunit SecG